MIQADEMELRHFKGILEARDKIAQERKKRGLKPVTETPQAKKRKIIAMSCGSKNGFCESYIKAAAMGAEELGVETEFIRASDLTVKPCRACHTCEKPLFEEGKLSKCPIKDDAQWILEKTVLGDSATIISAPIYHLSVNALLTTICQRMHPIMFNNLEMLKKRKVAGIICVGGGIDGWTPLGLTGINIWVQHFARLVDQVQVEMRYRDVDWFGRAKELGRNVARAMHMPIEEVKYVGEKSRFACPVCHCDVLKMPDEPSRNPKPGEYRYKPSDVVCPVCWVHGNLSFEGGELKVEWDEWDVNHPRFSEYGVFEHLDVIMKNFTPGSELYIGGDDLKEKYASYGNFIKP